MKKLLMVGFGDIARRVAARLPAGVSWRPVARSHGRDLDRPETLAGLGGWADAVLHCAPPPGTGNADAADSDPRTANLLAALEARILPGRIVYVSTSGVYGDCGGALVDETRVPNPQSARARRRVHAERQLAIWCNSRDIALVILRVPGIYAADRLPLERLRAGTPVLRPEDDVYTNHIHAEDLAAICIRALELDFPEGIYNASDDTRLKMGEWLELVAERSGLPRAPRVARAEAATRVAPEVLAFMSESRLLDNSKLKGTLGARLAFPTVHEGLPRLREIA
jgi:nucleoside-diphosphate-sugar epimerase